MSDESTVLTAEERASARVFLQRSEVRLSTLHRTATALLSGAGVLVLLPALSRDTLVTVLRALLADGAGGLPWSLAAMVVSTLVLSFVMIWLLLRELTRFYFHANHVAGTRGTTFTPRFTLTSLRLPRGELGVAGTAMLERARTDPSNVELLVPANEQARRSIDAQIAAYEGLGDDASGDDVGRATALLRLAGVRDRDLLSEVVKVEYGMARHVIRVQVIVLRYIKALLAVLVTLLSTFVMAAAVESSPQLDDSAQRWVLGAILVWCPTTLFVVAAPVRWLGRLLMGEGATVAGIRYDRDLTRLERVASWFSSAVLVAALVVAVVLVGRADWGAAGVPLAVVAVGSLVAHLVLVVRVRTEAAGHRSQ